MSFRDGRRRALGSAGLAARQSCRQWLGVSSLGSDILCTALAAAMPLNWMAHGGAAGLLAGSEEQFGIIVQACAQSHAQESFL